MTDEADLRWALPRLCPTPFGHFTQPAQLRRPDADMPPRVYIRCRRWAHPGFDSYAAHARVSSGWSLTELDSAHLPYITDPQRLATVLLELAA